LRAISVFLGVGAVALLGAGLVFGLTQCSSIDGGAPPPGASKYGSYLAARFASGERDATSAARYYDRALKFDPDNPEILERTLISEVAGGDLDGAAAHATTLTAKSQTARMPHLVLGVKALRDGGYALAIDEFSKISGNAAAEIASQLGKAYALLGQGKTDAPLLLGGNDCALHGLNALRD
jgi:Flp pilus assembly protein TadD